MSDRSLGSRAGIVTERIYADYAAGAPLRPEARAAIDAALASGAVNASSTHWAGARARALLEDAREQVAAAIGADPLEIVFTSGATESNNLALLGAAAALEPGALVAALASDHSSALEPVRALGAARGRSARVPVDTDGLADPEQVAALRPALLSFALVNAETGVVQDARRLVDALHAHGGVVHVDAAQAPAVLRIDVADLDADLLTLSGHKLGGPAGTGALFVRRGTPLRPVQHGGAQERGLRPGTENVAAIAGFAAACTVAARDAERESSRLGCLAARLEDRLVALHPHARVSGPALPSARRAPHVVNVTFGGVRGESLVTALDLEGIAVSAGSACAAGAILPSHVLLAMGRTRDEASSALRVSLGAATTDAEVTRIIAAVASVLARAGRERPAGRSPSSAIVEVAP